MINPRDIKVLIAEDEPDLRDLLATKFRVFGFNVSSAHNGSAAWDKLLADKDIQIVITDIRMPNGSGYDLLKKCKDRDPVFPRVFLISAFTDYTEAELFSLGAEGFINKPFDTKILLNIVRKSLLKTSDRWRAQNAETPKDHLNFIMDGLEISTQSGELAFGRGGFYAPCAHDIPEDGTLVSFDLKAAPWALHGTGFVRWSKTKDNRRFTGIEIVSLAGESSDALLEWIEKNKPQAYIPTPL